ncbi:hypothetical protein EON68_01395, partial [archaeon]
MGTVTSSGGGGGGAPTTTATRSSFRKSPFSQLCSAFCTRYPAESALYDCVRILQCTHKFPLHFNPRQHYLSLNPTAPSQNASASMRSIRQPPSFYVRSLVDESSAGPSGATRGGEAHAAVLQTSSLCTEFGTHALHRLYRELLAHGREQYSVLVLEACLRTLAVRDWTLQVLALMRPLCGVSFSAAANTTVWPLYTAPPQPVLALLPPSQLYSPSEANTHTQFMRCVGSMCVDREFAVRLCGGTLPAPCAQLPPTFTQAACCAMAASIALPPVLLASHNSFVMRMDRLQKRLASACVRVGLAGRAVVYQQRALAHALLNGRFREALYLGDGLTTLLTEAGHLQAARTVMAAVLYHCRKHLHALSEGIVVTPPVLAAHLSPRPLAPPLATTASTLPPSSTAASFVLSME